MRIKTALMEAFDQMYKVSRKDADEFFFVTDKGNQYEIMFYRPSHVLMFLQGQEKKIGQPLPAGLVNVAEVDFTYISPNGVPRYKFMGGEKIVDSVDDNPLKIYATVMSTVAWYVAQHKLDAIFFSGESKLAPLYERMVRRYLPKGFSVVSGVTGNSRYFCVYRDK